MLVLKTVLILLWFLKWIVQPASLAKHLETFIGKGILSHIQLKRLFREHLSVNQLTHFRSDATFGDSLWPVLYTCSLNVS